MRMLLALNLGDPVANGATVRAHRTIGPAHRLKGFAGLVFVGKHRVLKVCHVPSPTIGDYSIGVLLSSI